MRKHRIGKHVVYEDDIPQNPNPPRFIAPTPEEVAEAYRLPLLDDDPVFESIMNKLDHQAEERMNMNIQIQKLNPYAQLPKYAHSTDAGFDLYANETVRLEPGQTKAIGTGLIFAIPEGYEVQVRPRSGMSLKTKLRIANAPGTIDSGFTGEVKIIMENTYTSNAEQRDYEPLTTQGDIARHEDADYPKGTYVIHEGERIAQGVPAVVPHVTFEETNTMDDTDRGSTGFGDSGSN